MRRGKANIANWAAAFVATVALTIVATLPQSAFATPVKEDAVIIGNRDYQGHIPDVDFAANDADAFRKFVIDVLGYDPDNIIYLRDATQAQLLTAFGNRETHEGKLWRYLDPDGNSDVVVFYSGHGVPSLKDKRGYLLPVNADPDTPEINGYPLDTLLANLGKLKAKSVSVFLDACFSGDSQKGRLVRATSGIAVTPKLPKSSSQMTVITAAQGDQVASWDFKAKHGLFTKHLLDALYGEADTKKYGNNDGNISLREVRRYLDKRMTRAARREYGRYQNVWVTGSDANVLVKEIPETRVASVVTTPKPKAKYSPSVKPASVALPPKPKLSPSVKPAVGIFPGKYKPGDIFRDCDKCPEMVVIPTGSFQMGDLNGGGSKNEKPVHGVDIAYSFAVGRFEVTFAEWDACVAGDGCGGYRPNDAGWGRGRRPVMLLTWDEAREYIAWLGFKTGKRYRLLSESEWEYVARAGTTSKYWWGDGIESDKAKFGSHDGKTKPAGSYLANRFGLFDVHGNVWEWVEDCWNDNYMSAPSDGSARTTGSCHQRVLRGGSSAYTPLTLRSANRHRYTANIRTVSHGFRVARTLSQ